MSEPGVYSLLYASRPTFVPASGTRVIDRINAQAQERNASLNVTGALIYTGAFFAQLLEGEESHVRQLMDSIRRDPRHKDLRVAHAANRPCRALERWSLIAYAGPSQFVEGHVGALLKPEPAAPSDIQIDKVRQLIVGFATA